jgi:NAD(P)-dependent dehydrogenase (short-subunit alcohol dehydrogenase family)
LTTTLVTGANKGLGRETARQLIAAGHTVYVGHRQRQQRPGLVRHHHQPGPDGVPVPDPGLQLGQGRGEHADLAVRQGLAAAEDLRGRPRLHRHAHHGSQTVEEGAEIIVAMAQIGADGPSAPTGGYFDRHGPIPW